MSQARETLYLFDIDGTLLLSGGAGKRALERVFQDRYGVADAMDGISPNGLTDPIIVERMFEKLGRAAEAAEIASLIAAYEAILEAEVATSTRFRLMPAARETVEALASRGAALGLATGNTEAGARIKMQRAGLWKHFRCGGYGSDSRERSRLVAVAIERANECFGRRFEDVLVIGDTPFDVHAARACGARCVAVATGGHSEESLRAAGADEVYPSLAELLPKL
jgi:phosphoglycolate phosphatase-like HAD superfamily hydrolase